MLLRSLWVSSEGETEGALTAVPCNWNQSSGFLVVGRGLSWGLIGENVVVVVWIEVGDDDEANCCK